MVKLKAGAEAERGLVGLNPLTSPFPFPYL